MTEPISFKEFDSVYQDSVRAVFEHWTVEMQSSIAAHCYSWSPGLKFAEHQDARSPSRSIPCFPATKEFQRMLSASLRAEGAERA